MRRVLAHRPRAQRREQHRRPRDADAVDLRRLAMPQHPDRQSRRLACGGAAYRAAGRRRSPAAAGRAARARAHAARFFPRGSCRYQALKKQSDVDGLGLLKSSSVHSFTELSFLGSRSRAHAEVSDVIETRLVAGLGSQVGGVFIGCSAVRSTVSCLAGGAAVAAAEAEAGSGAKPTELCILRRTLCAGWTRCVSSPFAQSKVYESPPLWTAATCAL